MCGLLSDRSDVMTVCGLKEIVLNVKLLYTGKKTTQESAACVVSDF